MKKFEQWGLFALFCSGVFLGVLASWRIAEDKALGGGWKSADIPSVNNFISRK